MQTREGSRIHRLLNANQSPVFPFFEEVDRRHHSCSRLDGPRPSAIQSIKNHQVAQNLLADLHKMRESNREMEKKLLQAQEMSNQRREILEAKDQELNYLYDQLQSTRQVRPATIGVYSSNHLPILDKDSLSDLSQNGRDQKRNDVKQANPLVITIAEKLFEKFSESHERELIKSVLEQVIISEHLQASKSNTFSIGPSKSDERITVPLRKYWDEVFRRMNLQREHQDIQRQLILRKDRETEELLAKQEIINKLRQRIWNLEAIVEDLQQKIQNFGIDEESEESREVERGVWSGIDSEQLDEVMNTFMKLREGLKKKDEHLRIAQREIGRLHYTYQNFFTKMAAIEEEVKARSQMQTPRSWRSRISSGGRTSQELAVDSSLSMKKKNHIDILP